MENAVQAFKTAAAVLIFIIAITITFTMFSKAKASTDAVTKVQDKQAYLDSPDVSEGILYTSVEDISGEKIPTMTIEGYRIVGAEDVISTLYRYSLEKYGVTIIKEDGTVIARFDSNTESIIKDYNSYKNKINDYESKLSEKTTVTYEGEELEPKFNGQLSNLYRITVEGNANINCGAPWYGNEKEIAKRVNADIDGQQYIYNGSKYTGKNLKNELTNKTIIEIVNEIDNNEYLKDEDKDTSLVINSDNMSTIEIIYIVK